MKWMPDGGKRCICYPKVYHIRLEHHISSLHGLLSLRCVYCTSSFLWVSFTVFGYLCKLFGWQVELKTGKKPWETMAKSGGKR
jgi:hypothetical protein